MKITDFVKNQAIGIVFYKKKQEFLDMLNQRTKISFWAIMFVTTDKQHPPSSFHQQPTLPKK